MTYKLVRIRRMHAFVAAVCAILCFGVDVHSWQTYTATRLKPHLPCFEMTLSVKKMSTLAIAASLFSFPVFAKEGDPAKLSIFGNDGLSSPFTAGEVREDPIYSPYSPYGNGEKAVYKRGNSEELKFYQKKFEEGA
jgi:hypothetical protein